MEAVLIFPNSLFTPNDLITPASHVYVIEHPVYFTLYKFHKLKLILHRASMKYYYSSLKTPNKHYITFSNYGTQISRILSTYSTITFHDPVEHMITKEFGKHKGINIISTPLFILTADEATSYMKGKKSTVHYHFFEMMKKKTKILSKTKSYDTSNRSKFPSNITQIQKLDAKTLAHTPTSTFIKEAINYINTNFKSNPGSTNFYLPIDNVGAKKWFKNFIKTKLAKFGPYQDAVSSKVSVGYHSLLSPLINIGLISPLEVVKIVAKQNVPIQSKEGFIRQVLGWREYVRCIYITRHEIMNKSNYFNSHKGINKKVWYEGKGTTGYGFIDDLIKKTIEIGYLHHIERLMYIGNFFLIHEIDVKQVYKWFMIMFVDSYNWVMEPNVYGMSQYSIGRIMMTRPYIGSINYVEKMSDYEIGEEEKEEWNMKYHAFIKKHKNKLKGTFYK